MWGSNERNVVVFVSSGFRDMEHERNILINEVFPSVREYCYDRGITFSEIDLRIGVSEDESKEGRTLEICLEEIERSRPFFIGIVGERYGWRPKQEDQKIGNPRLKAHFGRWSQKDWSATAMEMMYAVLDDNVSNSDEFKKYCRFYLRNPSLTEKIFNEHRGKLPSLTEGDYYSTDSTETAKLKELRKLIKEKMGPEQYSDYSELGGSGGFAELVRDHLIGMIDNKFPPRERERGQDDKTAHYAYANSCLDGYCPNKLLELEIHTYLAFGDSVVVKGPSGSGKSALLASVASQIEERNLDDHPITHVFLHHCGIGRERTAKDILRRIGSMLRQSLHMGSTSHADPDPVGWFQQVIDQISAQIPEAESVLVVIDALDQVEESFLAQGTTPHKELRLEDALGKLRLNRRVRFLVSTTGSPVSGFVEVQMPQIESRQLCCIAANFNERYRKLDPKKIPKLISRLPVRSPFYLRTILEELRLGTETNFGTQSQDKHVDNLLEGLLKNDTNEALAGAVLDRVAGYLDANGGTSLVMRFRKLLLTAKLISRWVTADDLRELAELTPIEFARIRHLAPRVFSWRGDRLGYGHRIFSAVAPTTISAYELSFGEGIPERCYLDERSQPIPIDDILEKAIEHLARKPRPLPNDYFSIGELVREYEWICFGEIITPGIPLKERFFGDTELSDGYRTVEFFSKCTSDQIFWMMTKDDPALGRNLHEFSENIFVVRSIVGVQHDGAQLAENVSEASRLLAGLPYFRQLAEREWMEATNDADVSEISQQEQDRDALERWALFEVQYIPEAISDKLPESPIERLASLGQHPDEETRRKAVSIREKHLGTDAFETAVSFNNLATHLFRHGNYEEADQWFRRAMESLAKRLGDEQGDMATIFNNFEINSRMLNKTN